MLSPIKSHWVNGIVVEQKAWNERLFSLQISIDEVSPFDPGQFIRLRLKIDGDWVDKAYSLVNTPSDDLIEIFYNVVPNGKLSTALSQLAEGNPIEISQPAGGFFTLANLPNVQHLWMIATGTGLAPYLSILRDDQLWTKFDRITLVHGIPTLEERAYHESLSDIQQKNEDQFHFLHCISREQGGDYQGRVTDALSSGALEKLSGLTLDKEHSHIMLCGNHDMINDMKKILGTKGMQEHQRFSPGHYSIEQYF